MMKKTLLALLTFVALQSNAQQIDYTLGKCSNNADSAIKAFNLGNLKYYANISKTAIENTMAEEGFKDCYEAFDLSQNALIHLDAALQNDDFATAQSHMIKVKELALEMFNEYNLCTIEDNEDNSNDLEISNSSDLTELELQKEKLRKQQELLKKQEEALLSQLEEKKQRSLQLEKQTFISTNQSSLEQNLKTYNMSLNACNCKGSLSIESISSLSEKNLNELKYFFIEEKVRLAEKYMLLLNSCKTK